MCLHLHAIVPDGHPPLPRTVICAQPPTMDIYPPRVHVDISQCVQFESVERERVGGRVGGGRGRCQ